MPKFEFQTLQSKGVSREFIKRIMALRRGAIERSCEGARTATTINFIVAQIELAVSPSCLVDTGTR